MAHTTLTCSHDLITFYWLIRAATKLLLSRPLENFPGEDLRDNKTTIY